MLQLKFGLKRAVTDRDAFVMGIVNATPDSFYAESRGGVERALQLIDEMPSIGCIPISNDRDREDIYKTAMRTCDCREWVRVLKTLYARKLERQAAGKKVTSADERYMRAAEDQLYGELATALGMQRDEMESYITERVEGLK